MYNFRDKQTTASFTDRMWDALVWEPPYARPDKTTAAIENFTNKIQTSNGSKNLTMNADSFDKTDHNKMYVNDLRDMANSKSQESSSSSERSGCDSSSESFNAEVSGGGFGVSASAAFGHSKARESCSSAFNAASNRQASDIRGLTDSTADSTTTASQAGLTEWTVCSFILYIIIIRLIL